MSEAINNIKNYEPGFSLGFPLPISLLDTTGATSGQVPQFNGTTVEWASTGSFSLPITTTLAGGAVAYYDQNNSIFGTGIKGLVDAYSSDNFATYFLGSVAGDFTSVGGATNQMLVGYQSLVGSTRTVLDLSYDSGTNQTQAILEASTLTHRAVIQLTADSTTPGIRFSLDNTENYDFPITAPTPGTALGYVSANTLGWVPVGGGSGLTIGAPITGGTADRILFEDASNNLAESADFTFSSFTGIFNVSLGSDTHLFINPASGQYYMGTTGGNKTLIQILDGFSNQIQNNVTGQFLVQQSSGARLIDGNTSTFDLYLGDVGSNANKTAIEILDSTSWVNIRAFSSGNPSSGLIKIGDGNSDGNDTLFEINDFAQQTFVQTNGDFGVQNVLGQRAINVNFSGGTDFIFEAGDVSNIINGTKIQVLDNTSTVQVTADSLFKVYDTGNHEWFRTDVANKTVQAGDINFINNGTKIVVEDTAQKFTFTTGGTDRFIAYKDWTLVGNVLVKANWQTYTGTGNVSINDNVSGLVYNPAAVNATATITLPSSSGGTGSEVTIVFGGTVTSGNPVVTALTIAPGAGNTIVDSAAPTTANAGDSLTYHKEGALWYRVH